MAEQSLTEGKDYYVLPDGRWVFTAGYLLSRGSCCRSGCRDCPYGYKKPAAQVELELRLKRADVVG